MSSRIAHNKIFMSPQGTNNVIFGFNDNFLYVYNKNNPQQ